MANKDVIFYFYKVATSKKTKGGFGKVLEKLSKLTSVKERNQTIDGDIVRWEQMDTSDKRYIYGDFGKLRMQILPRKGGVNELSTSLHLGKNEGIDELFAFVYDRNSGVLVTQYNHYGSSISAFQKYVLSKVDTIGPIAITPILSVEGAKRLNKISDVRKVRYKVARPTVEALNPVAGGFGSAIDQFNEFGAYAVESTVSMNRRKSSLIVDSVLGLYNFLVGSLPPKAVVEKFELTVYENGVKDTFDLIQDRLKHTESLSIAPDRTITFDERKGAAVRALNTKRKELIAQFGDCCS